jgi:hypothetical protein
MSAARQDAAAAVLQDGRVLIVGGTGVDASGNPVTLASSDIFDPSTGVSAGPALAVGRSKASATTQLDGKVAVIGGSNGSADLNSIEIFDPVAGNFSSASASLATPRSGHLAFLLPKNNEILVVGGQSAGADLASAELFIPWNNSVQGTGMMSVARSAASGTPLSIVDGLLMVAGGSSQSTADLYSFATVKTDASDYAPGTIVTITGTGWQPGETVALSLLESPLIDTPPPMTALADVNGNISNNQFSPDIHDLAVRFYLTATGSQSQAQNTFTDKAASTTTITSESPVSPSAFGQSVTVNVSVTGSGGTPTGTVDVCDAAFTGAQCKADGCTVTLSSGSGHCSLTPSTAGIKSLNANYNGNSSFSTSSASAVSYTVSRADTATTITSNAPNPSVYGQAVVFGVSVTHTGSTVSEGCVQLFDGVTAVGSLTSVVSGNASVSVSTLSVGLHSTLTARYTDSGGSCPSNGTTYVGSTSSSVSQTVGQKTLTPSITGNNKVYDGTTTATLKTQTLTGVVGSDNVSLVVGAANFATSNVGHGLTVTATGLSLSGTDVSNYVLSTTTATDNSANITPAPLTITASSGSMTSGGTVPTITASYATFVPGDSVSSLTTQPTCSTTATSSSAAGSYPSTCAGAVDPNYTFTYVPGTVTVVGKTDQTITFGPLGDKTYGDPSFGVSATASSGLPVSFNASGNCSISGSTVTITSAGSCTVKASQGGNSNYNPAPDVSQSFKIAPRPITVTADAKTKVYGDSDPALTYQVTSGSLVGTDSFTGGLSRVTGENVGLYAIQQNTLALSTSTNYSLTYVGANLTITQKPVTASITASDKTYEGTNTATITTCSISGKVVGDDVGCTVTNAHFASSNANAIPQTVTATVALSGLTASNYTLGTNTTATTTATITKADAHITVTPYTSETTTYDNNPHTASGTAIGVESTPADLNSLLHLGGTTHTEAGDYPTDSWSFDGNGNYNSTSGVVHDSIAKANANITVTPYSVTYNGSAHTAVGSATGVGGVDLSSGFDLSGTTRTHAGDYPTDTWSFSGGVNYNDANGVIHDCIKKADATIVVTPYTSATTTYDGRPHTASGTATGVNGESLSGLDLGGTTHTNAGDYPSDPWTFTDGTGNYKNTSGTVHDSIAPKPVTVSITGGPFTYDGNPHSATITLSPPIAGYTVDYSGSSTAPTNAGTYMVTVTITDPNYVLSGSGVGSITINPKPVTATIIAAGKPYDGTTTVKITNCSLSGVIGSDNVYCTATGAFASPDAGSETVNATVSLAGTAEGNYALTSASATTTATISKVDQTITWSNPADIVYGTALSGTQLNATVAGVAGRSFPGALTYTPSANTILSAGANQSLTVTAASTINYNPATKTVYINVSKATPVVNWANPADIIYGTALGVTQLNATFTWTVNGVSGSVAGVATYSPAAGTIPNPGSQTLSVSFAPTDTTDYNPATGTVTIGVKYFASGLCDGDMPGTKSCNLSTLTVAARPSWAARFLRSSGSVMCTTTQLVCPAWWRASSSLEWVLEPSLR